MRQYFGITDAAGAVVEKRLFDAWGAILKVQNRAGTTLNGLTVLDRGYTGHEHLQSVGLIHMNGRLYDPKLHRFLQTDNYVQDPGNTQNYNSYGYVLNNPLKYTDPSGWLTQEEEKQQAQRAAEERMKAGKSMADWYAQHSGIGADGITNVQWMNLGGQGVLSPLYNSYVKQNREGYVSAMQQIDAENKRYKISLASGGLSGNVLNATFSVSGVKASGLQVIQTFYGSRRTDGLVVGTYHWTSGGVTYDAFVDGGKKSPYVTLSGNSPAHGTMPYYLTAGEVASQVTWNGTSGTIQVYDLPGAIYAHGCFKV